MKKLLLIAAATMTVASGTWANDYTLNRAGTSGGHNNTAFVELNTSFGDGTGLLQFSYNNNLSTWEYDWTTAATEWIDAGRHHTLFARRIVEYVNTTGATTTDEFAAAVRDNVTSVGVEVINLITDTPPITREVARNEHLTPQEFYTATDLSNTPINVANYGYNSYRSLNDAIDQLYNHLTTQPDTTHSLGLQGNVVREFDTSVYNFGRRITSLPSIQTKLNEVIAIILSKPNTYTRATGIHSIFDSYLTEEVNLLNTQLDTANATIASQDDLLLRQTLQITAKDVEIAEKDGKLT